jgi:hypothetical protein
MKISSLIKNRRTLNKSGGMLGEISKDRWFKEHNSRLQGRQDRSVLKKPFVQLTKNRGALILQTY